MRDHAIVSPRFWTGETGKQIRELGSEAQCLALYLLTCPSSNMIGLYYLPMPILCHELGISREGASKGLLALSSVNYAHYDPLTETVFVPKMSMHQLSIRNGDSMNERDKRLSSIHKQLETYAKSPFAKDFLKLYKDVFHIPEKLQLLINGTKPRMEIEGASKGLRRGFLKKRARKGEQEQEQEQDKGRSDIRTPVDVKSLEEVKDQEEDQEQPSTAPPGPGIPTVEEFVSRWNAMAKRLGLSPVRKVTDDRRRKLKTRLRSQEWFAAFVQATEKLPLGGDWQPSLDWFIRNEANVFKVVEGVYDRWGKSQTPVDKARGEQQKFLAATEQAEEKLDG